MAAGPHARCGGPLSGHQCDPHAPRDHHVCIVSGVAHRLLLLLRINNARCEKNILFFLEVKKDTKRGSALWGWCPDCSGRFGPWGK